MKTIFFVFSILFLQEIHSQEFLFKTKISVLDVWETFFANPPTDGPFIFEKMTKVKDPKTGIFDTTSYAITNLKGQTVYIFSKYNTGGMAYSCNINYKNRIMEDPLWQSDDTVVIIHRLFSRILSINTITSKNANQYKPKFQEDTNGTVQIKTIIFFNNKRKTLKIRYEDLNAPDRIPFIKIFKRKGDYYILQY